MCAPRSFVTATGLILVPNIVALERVVGRVLMSWGTPICKSFVLSGLMSSEFLQHQINISLRSSFIAEITSCSLLDRNPRKSFVSST